ncbi:MAG TPA: HAMP domain-containing sensor histidine kinase [Steroidobacteraceae bacterium]|nr:HAMP domain-containing sensor histidine kinase [Steroidobacteraceae bacterium]
MPLKHALARLATAAPFILLAASALLTVLLAWRAFASAASHRQLAERVLHDYAELAATEFSRRTTAYVGNYGVVVALRALAQTTAVGPGLPLRQALQDAMPTESRRAIELVGPLFRFDTAGAEFVSEGAHWSPSLRGALQAAAARPHAGGTLSVRWPEEGSTRVFVLAPHSTGWTGFELSLPAVSAWLSEFISADPLLPRTLAAIGTVVTVRAPDGRAIFRSPDQDTALAPLATLDLRGQPAISGLDAFTVEIAIDPATASGLVIGGLPGSQTAFLLGLALLSAALAAAAALQIRRERRHADMRRDFVTRASHELRTPVARIRMFTETLLLDRVRSDDERRDTLQALDRGARRLSMLIDNVLQLAGSRAGAPHVESIDAAALIRDIAREFEVSVGATDAITVAGPPRLDCAIDAEALRQVLTNLLDNAWKYGGSPPAVSVQFGAGERGLTIAVEDDGPGVPEADRERIWHPYVRLERHRTSSIAGTGIGLAVVKDLVTRSGGSCHVERSARGARFVVVFP